MPIASSSPSSNQQKMRAEGGLQAEMTFKELPKDVTIKIFNCLTFATRRTILPLVCKDWYRLTRHAPELWSSVTLCAQEEEIVILVLHRAGQSGSLFHAIMNDHTELRVSKERVLRWIRSHLTSVTSIQIGNTLSRDIRNPLVRFELGSGGLVSALVALKDNLRHLEAREASWVHTPPGFSELCWLTKLRSLFLSFGPDDGFSSRHLEELSGLLNLQLLHLETGSSSETPWHRRVMLGIPSGLTRLQQLNTLVLEKLAISWPSWKISGLNLLGKLSAFKLKDIQDMSMPRELQVEQIAELSRLVYLNLDSSSLTSLPDLHRLTRLRKLRCVSNDFLVLPVAQLVYLAEVEELDFRYCDKMVIPEWVVDLACLRRLRILSLDFCRPTAGGMRGLPRLAQACEAAEPGLRVVFPGPRPNTPARSLENDLPGARSDVARRVLRIDV